MDKDDVSFLEDLGYEINVDEGSILISKDGSIFANNSGGGFLFVRNPLKNSSIEYLSEVSVLRKEFRARGIPYAYSAGAVVDKEKYPTSKSIDDQFKESLQKILNQW